MKTYFKKEVSSFCLDDNDQTYTQVNIGRGENAVIRGANIKVFEHLMTVAAENESLTEEEFGAKKSQALLAINN
jgi:hypothetical protein